jgi:hypothetical protein
LIAGFAHAAGTATDSFQAMGVTQDRLAQARATVRAIFDLVGGTAYPFSHPAGSVSAGDHLRAALADVDGNAHLRVALQCIGEIYFRLLGRVAALGEELERALAAAP